jgi:UTP--glucose-1-phosphate uridylyltransferase
MKKIKKAVIPAAGFGTRFLPATKSMPKEMLPIIDRPAIHYAVEEAVKAGITEIIFITGRGKRAIEDYFDHSYELEDLLRTKGKHEILKEVEDISEMADIVYIRQKEALGLGHAILRARDWVGDEPFLVILPDMLLPKGDTCLKSMIDTFEESEKSVIAVQEVPWEQVSSYGIINKDGGKESFEIKGVIEKPTREEAPSNLSIFGRYLFTPEIFNYLEMTKPGKGGEIQLTDAVEMMLNKEGVLGVKYDGKIYDTGDKLGFLKATVDMALMHEKLSDGFRSFLREKL